MAETLRHLYGKAVSQTSRMTLAAQVYCILCEEIQSGRWQVGERLPGVAALADMSDVSRAPIQQAFSRLEAEGWVESRPRSGTYLKAMLPFGKQLRGAIGVALPKGAAELNPTQALHLHAILETTSQLGYVTEVVSLDEDVDWSRLNCRGHLFTEKVQGIVSLHSFPCAGFAELPEDRVPVVFWTAPFVSGDMRATPVVSHDTAYGFYMLTKHALEQGHRRIAFCACRGIADPLVQERRRGHVLALAEAGLEFDETVFQASRALSPDDAWALGDFMEERLPETTAFICQASRVAQSMVAWADHRGFAVPGRFSVFGHLPEVMRPSRGGELLTGLDYRLDDTVKTCLRMLEDQVNRRASVETSLRIRPLLVLGDSSGLAPSVASGR